MALDAGPYPKDLKQCGACDAEIVFLKTKKGKWMPVNVDPTDDEFRGPTAGEKKFRHGEHQPHFVTCPCAGEFRR